MSVWSRRWTALTLSAMLAVSAAGCGNKEAEDSGDEPNSSLGINLGMAEGLTVVDDPDALQKAVDEAFASAAREGMDVEYEVEAFSKDGSTFTCYFANPASSNRNVFITIYGDTALTDELYLSQLIPPGMAIREVTLNHPLLPGEHPLNVIYTQVDEENGENVIVNQGTVAVRFNVSQ